ncbi:iron-containing redox enzyme family protein [Enterovibrio norvegicus]|uniref:iron-containing redox enzyme family protein n=1 Tax=Enterovibrio norvegicus TaxID=188144 RepID=UPI0024B22D0F|nr:iron-containing redox enzyme family protein [Enterovibrio norvegicus]
MGNFYLNNPKFRHNLWTVNDDIHYLRFLDGLFEVDESDSRDFYQIRRYCTGHNTIEEVAEKSNISIEKIRQIIASFDEIGMLRIESSRSEDSPKMKISQACEMWAEQVEETHIINKIVYNEVPKTVLAGFLLETYHYIKTYPKILLGAAESTEDESLRTILVNYYQQEVGHQEFVVNSLIKMGYKRNEIETSIPLVSTASMLSMMEAFCKRYPAGTFWLATVIENDEFNEDEFNSTKAKICENYDLPLDSMDSFFKHSKVDYELGHSELANTYQEYLPDVDIKTASNILNDLHDIKHAIDVQCLEIEEYYSKVGNYIPRQRVDYFGV